jgi:hypothetical protein
MDILRGQELAQYTANSLHRPKGNRPFVVSDGDLFNETEQRNAALVDDFARRRMASRRVGNAGGTGDIFAAMPRYYNPMEYFQQQKIPWNINKDQERYQLYQWLDLFYRTHYLVPILVDIFTRFPLVGIELHSRDPQLREFYEDLFFNRLNYEQFLVDMGREYWTLGQSFPLGHFNETLGIWEEEELLDPTMVEVRKYPIVGNEQFFLKPDDTLKEIVDKKEPREVYYLLERDYPELLPFIKSNKPIPISNVLLRQVAHKVNPRDVYGTPILLRALRTLMHEEKLMASQDAIAERLYSPLILVKLGVQDMGQNRGPWLPGFDEIRAVRDEFDIALASDFRLMVHHFGIEVNNVFGREQMPRLDQDFDRIERRLMQTFGVNPSLLSGGAASQPYASSALQAEFISQILRTYQKFLKDHYRARALIVAEAQQHYDYEKRGDRRIPITEEVLEYDEEGNEVIVEKKKLLVPDMRMKVLDLRDEATQRQFLQALRQQGVPIPDQDIAMGMNYDFPEALEKSQEEMIQKTVAQQEAKVKTYDILTAKGLPIPPDLRAEIEGQQAGGQGGTLGVGVPDVPGGVPVPSPGDQIVMPPPPGGTPAIGPRNPQRGQRPEESDERSPIPPPGQVPTTGPQLPGVPGQPGMLGLPGAPRPAIGPNRSSVTSKDKESTKLPRKKAKGFTVPTLRDTNEENEVEEGESR